MSDTCLARVFVICSRWILCISHLRKTLPQPWYMHSLRVGLTIVTVSCTVQVQPVSSLYRTCSMLQLESYCVSKIRPHHHWRLRSTSLAARSAENWIGLQNVRPCVQVSASGSTNIPRWTVLTGVWISQLWSPPFSCSGWPCSSTVQNNEIRPKAVLLFLVQHSRIHSHCLLVIHYWHWLSSVCVWRLCYSAQHTKH